MPPKKKGGKGKGKKKKGKKKDGKELCLLSSSIPMCYVFRKR